jgi:hypothetical protein
MVDVKFKMMVSNQPPGIGCHAKFHAMRVNGQHVRQGPTTPCCPKVSVSGSGIAVLGPVVDTKRTYSAEQDSFPDERPSNAKMASGLLAGVRQWLPASDVDGGRGVHVRHDSKV